MGAPVKAIAFLDSGNAHEPSCPIDEVIVVNLLVFLEPVHECGHLVEFVIEGE